MTQFSAALAAEPDAAEGPPEITSGERKPPGRGLIVFLSTGAGLGLIPAAPGTFGTLAGIPLYLALAGLTPGRYIAAAVLVIAVAVAVASRAEKVFGRHDDGRVVIDEVAGYIVTMIGVAPSPAAVALGFLLFRAFDIVKPWPCRAIDRKWPGGSGVVMDDVAAGIYAALVLHLIIHLWPSVGRLTW